MDLCCGIGGMTSGLELAGERTELAVDKDDKAFRAWHNTIGHGAVQGDLTDRRIAWRVNLTRAMGYPIGFP